MTEAEFQAMIIEACRLHGVEVFHPAISLRSEPGYPDLTLVGATGVMFRELKTEKGRLSEHQRYWIAILSQAGADVGVWRPSQWPGEILEQIKMLGKVGTPKPPRKPRVRKTPNPYRTRGGKWG